MIHRFNSPFVFHTQVENHQTIKQQILPHIKEDCIPQRYWAKTKHAGNNVYTTYQNPGSYTIPDDMLDHIILNPFRQLLQEEKLPIRHANLTSLWWNYYTNDGYCNPHLHRVSDYSFIYLLHLTQPNNTIFALIPNYHHNENYSTEHIPEGNVIIAPSSLIHWATPCNGERAVVVGNLDVE
jgi:hypothetical protein